jgi:hypothetical protein
MTYYRLHRSDAPAFHADNAWSAPWGEVFVDASTYECRACDGAGEVFGEVCEDCDGECVLDADRGYSCCDSASELLAYFGGHCPADDADPVVVFEGARVGAGLDGEPLVVPSTVIRWTTIGQLRREA